MTKLPSFAPKELPNNDGYDDYRQSDTGRYDERRIEPRCWVQSGFDSLDICGIDDQARRAIRSSVIRNRDRLVVRRCRDLILEGIAELKLDFSGTVGHGGCVRRCDGDLCAGDGLAFRVKHDHGKRFGVACRYGSDGDGR